MMGVTVTVALAVWIASSLVEYKIVSNIPALKVLFHGLPGVIISIAIGAVVAFVLDAPSGAGVMLGQLLGLATNTFTFEMYSKMFALNDKRKQVQQRVNTYRTEHPVRFQEAVETIRLGFKTIVTIVLFVVYLIGLPARIYRAISNTYHKIVPARS